MTGASRPPVVLGLTGSIGMGKTTTAAMFADLGVPVWDADAAVHRLYGPGGAAVGLVGAAFPGAVGPDGIDRASLRAIIATDPTALSRIESIVHPLVAADRAAFLADAGARGDDLVVLDVPLLFEGGLDALCDATVVVSAPPEVQRSRVLARPAMTDAHLNQILSRQMPDADKRARATHVVNTTGMDAARAAVQDIVRQYRGDAG
jgi:dephospho-CoA kinase